MSEEQKHNIPQPIVNARQALAAYGGEESVSGDFEQQVFALAMRLDKTGEDISPAALLGHIEQGEEHIKNIYLLSRDNQRKTMSLSERYEHILEKKKPVLEDRVPDALWDIDLDYTQAAALIEGKKYKPLHICTVLLQQKRYDVIEALHEKSLIKTDKVPNALLFAALDVDDVWGLRFIHERGDDIFNENMVSFSHAVTEGSLECLKYLFTLDGQTDFAGDVSLVDLCAYGALEFNHFPIYQYMLDHHDISEEMQLNTLLKAIERDQRDFVIPALEHAGLEDEHIREIIGFAGHKGRLDIVKMIQAHVDVPLFDSSDSAEEDKNFSILNYVSVIICNGHVEVARCLLSDAPPLPNAVLEDALYMSVASGKIQSVQYLVEEHDVLSVIGAEKLKPCIEKASMSSIDVYEYLTCACQDKFPAFSVPPISEDMQSCINNWRQRLHMSPPAGLLEASLTGIKSSAYHEIDELLSYEAEKRLSEEKDDEPEDADEHNEEPAHVARNDVDGICNAIFIGRMLYNHAVYTLTRLFGTSSRTLDYLEKWGDFSSREPLRELADQIETPMIKAFNSKAWGDAVLKYGPEMGKLAVFADTLMTPPSLNQSRRKLATQIFTRGCENPDFAEQCIKLKITDEFFDYCLDLWNELNLQGFPKKNLPDISVDGEAFGKPGMRFSLMRSDDIRGFVLGKYVDCCQSLKNENGGLPAMHGISSESGGFYCLEDADQNITAMTWAWRGEKGELVFDSLEDLKGHMNAQKWHMLLDAFAQRLAQDPGNVTSFQVGVDNYIKLPKGVYNETGTPSRTVDCYGYDHPDSKQQFLLWRADPEGLQVYTHLLNEDDEAAVENLADRLYPDHIYLSEEEEDEVEALKNTKQEQGLYAYKGGELVGYAMLTWNGSDGDEAGFHLDDMAVDPECSNNIGRYRIAAELLKAVEMSVNNAKPECKVLHFRTHEENHAVLKAVEVLGFEYTGREEGYYTDGRDSRCFSMDLSRQSIVQNMDNLRARRSLSDPSLRYCYMERQYTRIIPLENTSFYAYIEKDDPHYGAQIWDPSCS